MYINLLHDTFTLCFPFHQNGFKEAIGSVEKASVVMRDSNRLEKSYRQGPVRFHRGIDLIGQATVVGVESLNMHIIAGVNVLAESVLRLCDDLLEGLSVRRKYRSIACMACIAHIGACRVERNYN